MLDEIPGVVNDVPVPKDEPPDKAAYQFNMPALAVAPIITVPVSHREPVIVFNTVGVALTIASTAILEMLVQPLFVAST